ncbi:HNH endonuclease [Streptomyces phage Madamato]|nr:HNH endonuclease [Streptomyces phage Madamato]
MQEEWREIAEFPGYSVSNAGGVRNDDTGRIMARQVNGRGIVYVGVCKRGPDSLVVQHKRSVSVLVAQTFVPQPSEEFDTPIHLDGDRFNNDVTNILWRPRWFAIKYGQQFQQDGPSFNRPVQIIETEEVYESSWDAATKLGLLDREIAMSVMSRCYVWPIFQHFRLLDRK